MKNKIVISDSEKSYILNMHESYKKTGVISEENKTTSFPPCVTKQNSTVSSDASGTDFIHIGTDKQDRQYRADGTVKVITIDFGSSNEPSIFPYHCNGDEIVIDWKNEIIDKPVDCFEGVSPAAKKSFSKLDAACQYYITSSGFEGVLARGNFSGWKTWPDSEIYDAILFLNNKNDLLGLKKAIECLSHDEVTLDSLLEMGVSNWGHPNLSEIKSYINSLK